jgi:hypothetical protein
MVMRRMHTSVLAKRDRTAVSVPPQGFTTLSLPLMLAWVFRPTTTFDLDIAVDILRGIGGGRA